MALSIVSTPCFYTSVKAFKRQSQSKDYRVSVPIFRLSVIFLKADLTAVIFCNFEAKRRSPALMMRIGVLAEPHAQLNSSFSVSF